MRHLIPIVLLLLAWPAAAAEGPLTVEARVLRVIDGDTIKVRATIWLDLYVEVSVRLRGVDTPELRGRCAREKERARAATRFVEGVITPLVVLSDIGPDKYRGRIDATVTLADGRDLSALLLAAGLGRPYKGGKRQPW